MQTSYPFIKQDCLLALVWLASKDCLLAQQARTTCLLSKQGLLTCSVSKEACLCPSRAGSNRFVEWTKVKQASIFYASNLKILVHQGRI